MKNSGKSPKICVLGVLRASDRFKNLINKLPDLENPKTAPSIVHVAHFMARHNRENRLFMVLRTLDRSGDVTNRFLHYLNTRIHLHMLYMTTRMR